MIGWRDGRRLSGWGTYGLGRFFFGCALGSGRSVPVHYDAGDTPWIESRLQDFFGTRAVPALGPSRVALTVHLLAPDNLDALANIAPVAIAISWAYFAVLESSPASGTLGKVALGVYVADLHGDPISFGRAAFRNGLKSVSWLLLGAGWVLAAFTPRKQALHDVMAGTLVLRKVHYFVIGPEAPTEPGDHWDGKRWVASLPPLEKS